jgi:hypothetical protein
MGSISIQESDSYKESHFYSAVSDIIEEESKYYEQKVNESDKKFKIKFSKIRSNKSYIYKKKILVDDEIAKISMWVHTATHNLSDFYIYIRQPYSNFLPYAKNILEKVSNLNILKESPGLEYNLKADFSLSEEPTEKTESKEEKRDIFK